MDSQEVAQAFVQYVDAVGKGNTDPTVEADVVKLCGQQFDKATLTASPSEAIDASILAARNYWGAQNAWGRYWVVSVAGADHGAVGLGLQASDDTLRAHRKLHTGPHAPGYAVTTPEEIAAEVGPRMNIAPYQPLSAAPRLPWSEVALVLIRPTVDMVNLDSLFALRAKHQFHICYETADIRSFASCHTPDFCVWPLGLQVQLDVSALLTRGGVGNHIPALNVVSQFARFAARVAAQRVAA